MIAHIMKTTVKPSAIIYENLDALLSGFGVVVSLEQDHQQQ